MDLSFGARLRLARERRQVTLTVVAAETKIKASLLEDLERDDISHWPEGVFRRGYLRAYARAIGLDPDAVVREFLELFPDSVEMLPAGAMVWPDRDGESGGPFSPIRFRRFVTSTMAAVPTFLQRAKSSELAHSAPAVGTDPIEEEPVRSDLTSGTRADCSVESFSSKSDPSAGAHDDCHGDGEPSLLEPGVSAAVGNEPIVEREAGQTQLLGTAGALGGFLLDDEPIRPDPDLSAAARLCTRLAQSEDRGEVASLLETAATVLDAAGLIVWSWSARASVLKIFLAHGYSDAVLMRIPTVAADAPNAVATAFRSAETCVVNSGDGLSGALAIPLMAPGGCVGVLALEFRHGGEQRESVRAFAMILAAQLVASFVLSPLAEAASA
jgi:transcriptional regulator with XRE-family HTH domain